VSAHAVRHAVAAGRPTGLARIARNVGEVLRERPELALSPLVLILVLGAWYGVTTARLLSPIVLPPLGDIAFGLVTLLTATWFPEHLVTTVTETVLGFVIGSGLAFLMAVFLHHVPLLRRVLFPYIITFQVTPSIVMAPIFVIWFGFGIESKVVVSITTVFFVVFINTLAGFDSVEPNAILLMRSMCASKRQLFFMLTLPTALPSIFAGLKTAATLAIIGALVGEFITARAGLGMLLTQFGFALKQDMVFATVLVVVVLGLVFFGIVEIVQRRIVWWRTE
jgi:NitT/TauT family transport system permease protein